MVSARLRSLAGNVDVGGSVCADAMSGPAGMTSSCMEVCAGAVRGPISTVTPAAAAAKHSGQHTALIVQALGALSGGGVGAAGGLGIGGMGAAGSMGGLGGGMMSAAGGGGGLMGTAGGGGMMGAGGGLMGAAGSGGMMGAAGGLMGAAAKPGIGGGMLGGGMLGASAAKPELAGAGDGVMGGSANEGVMGAGGGAMGAAGKGNAMDVGGAMGADGKAGVTAASSETSGVGGVARGGGEGVAGPAPVKKQRTWMDKMFGPKVSPEEEAKEEVEAAKEAQASATGGIETEVVKEKETPVADDMDTDFEKAVEKEEEVIKLQQPLEARSLTEMKNTLAEAELFEQDEPEAPVPPVLSVSHLLDETSPAVLGKETNMLSLSLNNLAEVTNRSLAPDRIASMSSDDAAEIMAPVTQAMKSVRSRVEALYDVLEKATGTADEILIKGKFKKQGADLQQNLPDEDAAEDAETARQEASVSAKSSRQVPPKAKRANRFHGPASATSGLPEATTPVFPEPPERTPSAQNGQPGSERLGETHPPGVTPPFHAKPGAALRGTPQTQKPTEPHLVGAAFGFPATAAAWLTPQHLLASALQTSVGLDPGVRIRGAVQRPCGAVYTLSPGRETRPRRVSSSLRRCQWRIITFL